MLNFIKKIIFLCQKPPVIIVVGNERFLTGDIIFQILKSNFRVRKIFDNILPLVKSKNETLIFINKLSDFGDSGNFKFLLKKSRQPIFVISHSNGISPESEDEVCKLAKFLPSYSFIIENFEKSILRKIKNEILVQLLTYGFQEEADFRATDVKRSEQETNFKINYEGGIVPFWLKSIFQEKEIYNVLASICVGTIKGINLVAMSQVLRDYKPVFQ